MSIRKYRTRLKEIEAVQWTGDNINEVRALTRGECVIRDTLETSLSTKGEIISTLRFLTIHTPDHEVVAYVGSYVVREASGKYYSCNSGELSRKYEEIEE